MGDAEELERLRSLEKCCKESLQHVVDRLRLEACSVRGRDRRMSKFLDEVARRVRAVMEDGQ